MHADVADYSSLMERDEDRAHQRVNEAFELLDEAVSRHGGTVAEKRGDALLAEFAKPSDALGAAPAFQSDADEIFAAVEDDICPQMRIGIDLGEVIRISTPWGSQRGDKVVR